MYLLKFRMMQVQDNEVSTSNNISVYNKTLQTADAGTIESINFDNIEDILDFSFHHDSQTDSSDDETDKRCYPMLHKIIAQKPVKLLDLKPIIDNFVNDVNEDENSEDDEDDKTETIKSKRRFQCIYCGSTFIRSTHLRRHMRLHTGAKPYACGICRKRFSRSDYRLAHEQTHRTDKVHKCCVCGKVYHDLVGFTYHCHSHDDLEFEYIAMERKRIRKIQVTEDPIPITIAAKKIELDSCIMIEEVDNSFDEVCITRITNPIYASYDQMIPVNDDTLHASLDQVIPVNDNMSISNGSV